MSSENTVADRLLNEARRKTARTESPELGKAAMIVGMVALVVSPISILGWIVGRHGPRHGLRRGPRPVSQKAGGSPWCSASPRS